MKQFKKVISIFLVLILLFSPHTAHAVMAATDTSDDLVISVENKKVIAGEEISVDVKIQNNPGILGAKLRFSFDEKLTLVRAKAGDAFSYMNMTLPGKFTSPCNFLWEGQDLEGASLEDGTILTLTFTVSEDAQAREELNIDVLCMDAYDSNINEVSVTTKNGSVTILDFTPGDVNADGKINITDLVLTRRYIVGGYDVVIDVNAANVNDDGKVSSADVIVLRRYLAGGYGTELLPPSDGGYVCEHVMTVTAYKAPTCTETGNIEHYYCTSCHKYFSDEEGINELSAEDILIEELGHEVVIDEAVEPTYEESGLTEGSHCSVCGEILVVQEVIEPLQKESYSITYNISNNDNYLAQIEITNNNPASYTKEDGLVLQNIEVPGYMFKGWYTAQTGGTLVTEIPAGSTGNKTFYAQWEKVEYTITYDSPDVPWDSETYTVDVGATLENPSWFGYTFIGWSNDNGFLVNRIKPGTTGNITLHANWTSNRNKATSYAKYADPIIIEDDVEGQFLFIYDIGKIDNVPLHVIETFVNTQTLSINQTYTITNTIDTNIEERIANTVSEATTKSSGWTLTNEWDQIYSEGSEYGSEQVKSTERTDEEGNTVGGKYFVSNSAGGSSYLSTESGGAYSNSSKVTTEDSFGINTSYDTSTEKYVDAKLGVENTTETSVGVSVPVKVVDVSAEVKNTTTVSAEASSGRKDKTSSHVDTSSSSYIGTVNQNDTSGYYNVAANQSSTWNSTTGFESSAETSRRTEVTSAISEAVSETTTYNLTQSLGGENSATETVAGTDTRSDEYSNTLMYSTGTGETVTKTVTYNSDRPGNYRLVTAGTVHVYGVVGYDVATASYYTYTYNVLSDDTYEFLDYSKDDPNFKDCENGLVTFDIPFEVNEYISTVTGKTNGLEFNYSGKLTGFDSTQDKAFDGTVVVPQYYSNDNGDGTYSAFKTTSFGADVFSGNTEIETVVLPIYVTEIPAGAFEGCTNLKNVVAYGVTKIGENAFKGCTSLESFSMDNLVDELGENSFKDVTEIKVKAYDSSVVKAAIASGAKKITIDISEIVDSVDNTKLVIPETVEYFALIGGGDSYENLQIESNAGTTFMSNMNFVNNVDIPLKLNSAKVTLARVTVVDAPGFALVLPADHTDLYLQATIALSSKGENAVISKNVTLNKANSSVAAELNLTGDYLICGTMTNSSMLTWTDNDAYELITIDEETYNKMLISCIVTFDPNGGTVNETQRVVYNGQQYGTLPTPERDYHKFLGWYTEAEGGELVTEDSYVSAFSAHTLYAHWELNVYTINFDANGGTVDETSRIVPCGTAVGELPVPERTAYDFDGWYTEDGTQITADTVMTTAETINVVAKWTEHAYTVSWNTGTGYTIKVERTSSPYVNAATGTLSNNQAIYYGDVLEITYAAATGYTLGNTGKTNIIVTGDVTSDDIYASATVNSYTYNVVYKSSNDYSLGSTTVTYKYGTTNTISAPAKTGYQTPSSQSVKWDSTSAKTITFVYTPTPVSTSQTAASGNWYVWDSGKYGITYVCKAEYQNRTSNSIQIRLVWTNTMLKNSWYGYAQYYTGKIGGTSTGELQIASSSTWTSGVNYDRTATKTSGWITVSVPATTNTVALSATYRDVNGVSGSWSKTLTIPTY